MIGKNLKYLRGLTGVTQLIFAAIFNIPLKNYQAYEEDRATPPIAILLAIAEYFDITVETLFTQDLSAKRHPKPSPNDKIINAYRSLQPKERKAVDALLFG